MSIVPGSRRAFVVGAASLIACAAPTVAGAVPLPHLKPRGLAPAPKPAVAEARRVRFDALNTGEKLDVVYWEQGRYLPEALAAVYRELRDHRTGDVHPIDPKLLDLLHALQVRLETASPIQVISGYRSPKTNTLLILTGNGGVARNSLHLKGMAIDLRLADRRLRDVHKAAAALQRGGVGLYTRSNFVHVDTGRVRYWGT